MNSFRADKTAAQRLILHASGFVFDPVCGRSYTASATGLRMLALLRESATFAELHAKILQEFDVPSHTAERDVLEFLEQIRRYVK